MMSIIRVRKEEKYAVIANSVLQNKDLSWEARGVMSYLLSKPDGWQCRNYDLINQGPAGKHIIRRVLKELQEAGYIYRYQKSDGHKIEWVTEIYETPELNTTFRNTNSLTAEEPTVGSSDGRESVDIVSTDSSKYRSLENTEIKAPSKISTSNGSGFDHAEQVEKQNLNQLANQVAILCRVNIDLASVKTRESLKGVTLALYGKSVSAADLKSFEEWWYNNYWAGKKGQPPTPAQVGDTWGQFEDQKKDVPIADIEEGFYI